MNWPIHSLAILTFLLIVPASTQGELIYAQQAQTDLTLGVPAPSQYDPSNYGSYSMVSDSFVIEDDALIDRVRWIGAYFNPAEPAEIRNFNIAFLGFDTPAVSESILGNANEEFLTSNATFRFYAYEADLTSPVLLRAGVAYSLLISATVSFPPQWGWHAGVGGNGKAALVYFNEVYAIPDRAFALYGTKVASVPEPTSIAMLSGMFALIWLGRSARRWRLNSLRMFT